MDTNEIIPSFNHSIIQSLNHSIIQSSIINMRKFIFSLALLMATTSLLAAGSGIPAEILKNQKAKYDKASNTLVLEDGFKYSVSKGLVIFNTPGDLRILLKGNAEFRASLAVEGNLIIDSEGDHTLSITSNISGSALRCAALQVNKGTTLNLLSRNSRESMFALDSRDITVNGATLLAEVTTANIAVYTERLTLNGSKMEKPKGGIVSKEKGCVCFGDGIPAKIVRITPDSKKK